MTGVTEGLPVVHIPEQRLVATVRGDMVNVSRRCSAADTERIEFQKLLTCLAPSGSIAPLIRCRSLSIALLLTGYLCLLLLLFRAASYLKPALTLCFLPLFPLRLMFRTSLFARDGVLSASCFDAGPLGILGHLHASMRAWNRIISRSHSCPTATVSAILRSSWSLV